MNLYYEDELKADGKKSFYEEEGSIPWNPRFASIRLKERTRASMITRHRLEVANCTKKNALDYSKVQGEKRIFRLSPTNEAGTECEVMFLKQKSVNISDLSVYENHSSGMKLELEIIEDPNLLSGIVLMCRDNFGDVIYVILNCNSLPADDVYIQQKVGFGCKITITDPCMIVGSKGHLHIIVNDDKNFFIHPEKDPKQCRFCGKPNGKTKCTRCSISFYCSLTCQLHDWKILKHKRICDAYISILKKINNHALLSIDF